MVAVATGLAPTVSGQEPKPAKAKDTRVEPEDVTRRP
jgi:hypothetical protein